MKITVSENLVKPSNISNVLLSQASNLKPSDRTINLPIYVSLIKSRKFILNYTVDNTKWIHILNIINYSNLSLLILILRKRY